ncbi:hypothetical protein OPQ81_003870 [Rhizoctonia solani]|nr:hypothetical protein OPQ81_003870 [Rhizoctonia solani]
MSLEIRTPSGSALTRLTYLTIETGYLRRDLSILDDIHYGAWLCYESRLLPRYSLTVCGRVCCSTRSFRCTTHAASFSIHPPPFLVHHDGINGPRRIGSLRLGTLTIHDPRAQSYQAEHAQASAVPSIRLTIHPKVMERIHPSHFAIRQRAPLNG